MAPPSFPEGSRLTLLGTVHREPCSEEWLSAWLETLSPERITLEMSPYALAWRLERGTELRQRLEDILRRLAPGEQTSHLRIHPEVESIRRLLDLPPEYRAASAYTQRRGVRLELLDVSFISARWLRQVEKELITEANLAVLISRPLQVRPVQEGYALARAMLAEDSATAVRRAFLAGRRSPEGVGLRDRRMAFRIRRRLALAPEARLCHIVGWVHLVEDEEEETLFSRLRDLRPRRILVDGPPAPEESGPAVPWRSGGSG